MGVKVNRCDIVPPLSGSAGVPVNAPYLLNGVDPSGLLTAEVNVLALATPQVFNASAPLAGDIGAPIDLTYDDGTAGAVGTGVALRFRAQNSLGATVSQATFLTRFTDATSASEDVEMDINMLAAGSEEAVLTVRNAGLALDGGTGAKTITTSKGAMTLSATGGTNAVTVSSAAGAASLTGGTTAAVTGATTATVQAGTGLATVASTSGNIQLTAGDAQIGMTVGGASVLQVLNSGILFQTPGAKEIRYIGASLTVACEGATSDLNLEAGRDIILEAGGIDRWLVDGTTGQLEAQGAGAKITNVDPGTTTGDAVVFEQILDAGVAAPTNGGATVAIVPGAEFIATATFTAPTGGAGTFLLQNNTGRAITLIGARAIIAGAGANTLAITVDNAGGTDLFTAAALAATGGTHLSAATTYTLGNAVIANGANIIITAEGSGATIDTILFLEFIAQ